jgi:isocitrate lyase
MSQYQDDIKAVAGLKEQQGSARNAINPESAARMRAQNKFKTGLDIAKYTAKIMRADMAAYDADHQVHPVAGLLARFHRPAEDDLHQEALQQHRPPLPLPVGLDGRRAAPSSARCRTSRCTKTAVSALIKELYTFLRQADARELGGLFRELDAARALRKPRSRPRSTTT